MYPVPHTEAGVSVSISEIKGRSLIGDDTPSKVGGPQSEVVYDLQGAELSFYPSGRTVLRGTDTRVSELLGV